MFKDWIPRSRSFYVAAASFSGSAYYLWWDRHQSKLIQSLYEIEASKFGLQPATSCPLPKITVFIGGSCKMEMAERRKLFRRHTARMLLKAGIDWEVLEVNEEALAKRINEVRLDDAEHEELERFPKETFIEAMLSTWASHDRTPKDKNEQILMDSFMSNGRSMKSNVMVALDPKCYDAIGRGIRSVKSKGSTENAKESESWMKRVLSVFRKRDSAKSKSLLPEDVMVHLVNIPTTTNTSFLGRCSQFVNTRQLAMSICQESMSLIKSISE